MKRYLFFKTLMVTFFLSLTFDLSAFHIIGGDLTYVCLGNGEYEFTAHLYRDCNCSNCADMPQSLTISIFECGTNISCGSLMQGDQKFDFDVPITSRNRIDLPDYPCYIPPDVCAETGTYRWKLSDFDVVLLNSADSYIVTFQKCCRNSTINNLNFPDQQGATYTTTISPKAQLSCNSSAVFNEFPPTIICAGVPLNFDHSATDSDGDSLFYELCPPLRGGGFSSAQGACDSPSPNPPCPPPYKRVEYLGAGFSSTNPITASPGLMIDPTTGILTGTPTFQGQYVVGVCVSEIRDGIVINRSFRDFQFNVTECDPTVETLLTADSFDLVSKEFFVSACGDLTLDFKNKSYKKEFIDEVRWEFEIDGQTQIFNEWSPSVEFPRLGTYTGLLLLNPGEECSDTATIHVQFFPEVFADFEFDYDTCNGGDVSFFDDSWAIDGEIIEWLWRMGDSREVYVQNPVYNYSDAGAYSVLLLVRDTNNCLAAMRKELLYFPLPEDIVIAPSTADGCKPVEIFFDNLSFPIDDNYQINWDFGDGNTGNDLSPSHLYEEAGDFTVTVELVSPAGCRTDTVFPNLIKVKEVPTANFSWSPEVLTTFNSTAEFTDESIDAARREWLFNQNFRTGEVNPTHTFRDTGRQEIRLIAFNTSGCSDTAFAKMDIFPEYTLYLPNAFTPNYDGKNDTYLGVGFFESARNYNMTIWNRWGEKIFNSTDPTEGWNGKKFNTGKASPQDVYTVKVTFEGGRGEPLSFLGQATLIR